ncbi:DUF4157 domain-containing protein [Corallococcus interemptor]|uniref:eCIS core domain-containing protein n=1 Tax=Corallococcus interemptor TaxID=2316720 RepID=UPI003CFCCF9F
MTYRGFWHLEHTQAVPAPRQGNARASPQHATGDSLSTSTGQPLPDDVRIGMEARFGHDLSRVRIHHDAESRRATEALDAAAFTRGAHIYLGAGHGGPYTRRGMSLLAHEVVHTLQQGGREPTSDRLGARDSPHEAEADRLASAITGPGPFSLPRVQASAPAGIQRKDKADASDAVTPAPRVDIVFKDSANRWLVIIGGIPVAEVSVESKQTQLEVKVEFSGSSAVITVRHHGGASLAPVADPGASLSYSLRFQEIDLRQGPPDRAGPQAPSFPGQSAVGSTDLVLAPSSALRWPDESVGELSLSSPLPPGFRSEFEEQLQTKPDLITGLVMDPENPGVVIGYKVRATTGLTRLVDREGNEVFLHEVGLEKPLFDPIDLVPTPGTVAKGAGVASKLGFKLLGAKTAQAGIKIPLAVIARMRGVSKALASRAARKGLAAAPGLVRKLTKAGLDHSFDRHAAQWFGRVVSRETHLGLWRELIERAMQSSKVFPWSTGASKTVAHLARVDGKYFVVQFFEETGELATAFVPNAAQLREMLKLIQ